MSIPPYIQSPNDLETSHEATRAGFLAQALEKGNRASPFIARAKELSSLLSDIQSVDEILQLGRFRDELIAAAQISEKASTHLSREELDEAVEQVLNTLSVEARSRSEFVVEVVYRYLLTKGDALGGQMRNWIGAQAAVQFSTAVESSLAARHIEISYKRVAPKSEKVQRILWQGRLLLFDAKPPKSTGFPNNIDIILLDAESIDMSRSLTHGYVDDVRKELLSTPSNYLACGELKGGYDPAGADEHWKTATSGLDRIPTHQFFAASSPKLFFVGAAIEATMASQIFMKLESGYLTHAANLTKQEQVQDLTEWLVSL